MLEPGDDERAADYPPTFLPLSAAPFYLPNLIASIVAALGIVAGSIGPWFSVLALDVGGVDFDKWGGVVTLAIGGACAVVLFVQLNWGRTNFSLRWAVPLAWAVLIGAVGCLAIAVVNIVKVLSVREASGAGVVVQVAWALWLVAISSGVLCVTASIVAAQIGKAAQGEQESSSGDVWAGAWRWGAVISSGIILVVAMASAYKPLFVAIEASETTETATRTVQAPPETITAAPRPTRETPPPAETVPAGAVPCPSKFSNYQFATSAKGTEVTTCEFAEEIRYAYVNQSARNGLVELNVRSPVTERNYTMTCRGNRVVKCIGGNNAVAYLY